MYVCDLRKLICAGFQGLRILLCYCISMILLCFKVAYGKGKGGGKRMRSKILRGVNCRFPCFITMKYMKSSFFSFQNELVYFGISRAFGGSVEMLLRRLEFLISWVKAQLMDLAGLMFLEAFSPTRDLQLHLVSFCSST
ncbi:hypothetical protein RJT34_30436 [Clitoria ternatea]|uniref:Uncharacterized protein n=1 Tax=Clitoria ternatea TaxID=43366 RepID=A0AAN9I420_CLITE